MVLITKKGNSKILATLLDEEIPIAHRKRMLAELCINEDDAATAVIQGLLKAATAGSGKDLYTQKKAELQEMIDAFKSSPQRAGMFLDLLPEPNGAPPRAHVRLEDGASVFPVVAEPDQARRLARGERVLLSAQAEALIGPLAITDGVGETGRLENSMDGRVEVSLHGDAERHVLYAGAALQSRLDAGEVPVGTRLLVAPRQGVALDVVPGPVDTLAAFRFLSREPVPDVVAERDIGDPPSFIEDLAAFCREEMTEPQRRRRYGLRRSRTLLLRGVSGGGKTLSVNASIRRIYEVMADVTGASLDELPPRVLRLTMSKLLSKWLGESDRFADQFADEITTLGEQTWPDGTELPVIVVLEEFDAIARSRGGDADGVYDRIQTTLLQRLDHTANSTLRDKLVIVFATTNVSHLIDPAWLRRVGGETWTFGRLRRRGFAAVLHKCLGDVPLAGTRGGDPDPAARRSELVRHLAAWLYSPNGADDGVIDIDLAGTSAPLRKHRRDFVTGSVVDRAVQRGAERACREEAVGDGEGLTAEVLIEAIDDQVRAVVDGVTPANANNFVDLPDGARVVNVRRLRTGGTGGEPAVVITNNQE